MLIDLTDTERADMVELIKENLAFYHETLRNEYPTKAAAMATFDACVTVSVYRKLDPAGAAQLRAAVEEEIEGYLD